MTWVVLSGALLVGVTGASGALLVLRRRAAWSGALLLVAALGGTAALALHGLDHRAAAGLMLVGATYVAAPMAVLAYPTWAWRRPLEFISCATVVGAGALGVISGRYVTMLGTMAVVIGLGLAVLIWVRIETSSGDTRTALQWLAVTAGSLGLVIGLVAFAGDGSEGTVTVPALILLCVPLGPAMAMGVLRPDVLDVRGVVVWGVVGFVAVIVYLSVFVGIVSGLEWLGGRPSSGALGLIAAVVAFGFHPMIVLLRGVIDQLLFGDRPDPLQAATEVADRIGDDPVLALQAVREALVLPYASLRADGQTLATSGSEVTHTRTLPLELGDDTVGEIVVGLRAGDLTLSASDAGVLRIVAPLLAQTLRARALASDVRESRNAAITAIEEERRRLRRDLHDGLGPTLTGVAFATDAARNQLRVDPAAADALLERLRADTSAAIAEVRRLVEGLRPPVLDELGLLGAVRQHAAILHADGGHPLRVTISAPDPLPRLSAAAEVTVYRIVVEALTNVARHAVATRAEVEIAVVGRELRLQVQDDGGAGPAWTPGVGMSSMRERAEQVGGTLTAAPGRGGGRVSAVIPMDRPEGG